jgi:phage terminase large subunit
MASIDIKIPDKVLRLLTTPKRIKILVGGRGSGKSISVTDLVIMKADQGARICCSREFQNTIDDSVHETIKQEIDRLGVEGFVSTNTTIKSSTGGEIFYKGLARNISSLQSLGAVDILWVEEAQTVSKKSLRVLTPSIRSGASDDGNMPEIWLTMNRFSRGDAVAEKYLARAEDELARCGYYEDDLCMVMEVNYTDNPWFPPELELERIDDEANLSVDEYRHIWKGEYLETVENAIIKKEWFDAAIDAHIKLGIDPTGATIATHDPADGGDSYGYACRTGILYHDIDELVAANGNDACDEATSRAIAANADLFIYDADGLGALLRNQIANSFKGIKCDIRPYKGSNAVDEPKQPYGGVHSSGPKDKPKSNEQAFKNKRAQYGIKLADRFYNTWLAVVQGKYVDPDTIISLSSEIKLIDKIRSEVCRIPTVPNGAGKIQLMSKERLKALYDMDSPGMYDCLCMGEELPQMKTERVKLKFRRAV